MTLKLQVGTSRKVATGDFGSHGANCSIELSLDPLAMEQPDVFQKRLTQLFKTCRQSVQDELERQIGSDRIGQPDSSSPTIRIAHDRVSQNGGGGRRTGRQATEKQLRFGIDWPPVFPSWMTTHWQRSVSGCSMRSWTIFRVWMRPD